MPQQFVLPLPHRAAMDADDFLVAPGNALAVEWIDRWPDWPRRTLIVHGPEGAGKTHLLGVWQSRTQGLCLSGHALSLDSPDLLGERPACAIDNAEAVAGDAAREEALLHLYNLTQEKAGTLLLTAARPPNAWAVALPDLRSRLLACPNVALGAPDDQLLAGLLLKHFSDRQLRVGQDVLDYILSRLNRSAASVAALVARLDATALAERRPITVPLARRVMEEKREL